MPRLVQVLTVGMALTIAGASTAGTFIGSVVFTDPTCQQRDICELAETFVYIDNAKTGWVADKGDKTDGASIPRWAQRFVGYPFRPEYLAAAVLHDQYSLSVRPVNGWFQTQRMFYEALRDSGVPEIRASILYAGVLIGSGKWITRMEGKPCPYGQTCLQNAPTFVLQQEGELFGTEGFAASFADVASVIEAADQPLTLAEIEALALERIPNPVYLENRSGLYHANPGELYPDR
ncbi:MAG: DUF1353 domain-containing protein [Pseudorhodobacter sp.]